MTDANPKPPLVFESPEEARLWRDAAVAVLSSGYLHPVSGVVSTNAIHVADAIVLAVRERQPAPAGE